MPMHSLPALGYADALAAAEAIRADVERRGKTAVIAVVDAHGELLLLHRLDDAPLSSIAVATNKAFTAARLRRSTRVLGESIRSRGIDIAYYGDARFVGFGGGMPVEVDGHVVGAVSVSGLTDTEDDELAALGIAAIHAARQGR
jgi:glc operon protein GlcG